MPLTTWTLTGDIATLVGGDADSVTAYLEPSQQHGFLHDPGAESLLLSNTPIDVGVDGTFTLSGVPDSSESGLSYRVCVTALVDGVRVSRATDRFTLDADTDLASAAYVDPSLSPEVILANATDAVVSGLVAGGALTNPAVDAVADAAVRATRGRWPVVAIVTDDAAPIVDTETYVNGDYTITDTDGGILHSGGLRIRGRGNSTWMLAKKPYRLNFDTAIAPLGMTAVQKNWALLANHFDSAKVNNHLALTLGAQMDGLTWTPEYRVVEVVLNGDFLGIYQLADLVRMEPGRLPGTAPDADTGAGLTGTYLLEVSNKEGPGMQGADPAGWLTPSGQWVLYDTPAEDELTEAQVDYIQGYVSDFEAALFSSDFEDPSTGWRAYADESSLLDWYLVNELLYNFDSALYSSCKFWKARDGKLHMGPLWDFDLSVGLGWESVTNPAWPKTKQGIWFVRLFQDAAFAEAAAARWPEVVALLGDYPAFIDRLVDSATLAIGRDDKRWSATTYPPVQADTRKRWLATRIAWLGTQLAGSPDADTNPVTYYVEASA